MYRRDGVNAVSSCVRACVCDAGLFSGENVLRRQSVLRLLSSSSACGYTVNRKWRKKKKTTIGHKYLYYISATYTYVHHICTSHGRDFVVILRESQTEAMSQSSITSHTYTIIIYIIVLTLLLLLRYTSSPEWSAR